MAHLHVEVNATSARRPNRATIARILARMLLLGFALGAADSTLGAGGE
jgi:hypothetical protein